MALLFYVLKEREPILSSADEFMKQLIDGEHVIRRTPTKHGIVSTAFIGAVTHKPGPFFETMVTGGPLDGTFFRYMTYANAEIGHAMLLGTILGLEAICVRSPDIDDSQESPVPLQ